MVALIRERLGIKGADLPQAMKRAGRLMPRRVHRAGDLIEKTSALAGNPKLARMQDASALDRAFDDITLYLMEVDVADRRRGRLLGILGSLAFIFIVIVAAVITYLNWQDYI